MDTGSEERERGVTVDIAQHHFSTDKADFAILDAPGHRDFVPNMIGGASMADLAVLVVDANQLESGMKGQTREHILLAKACGLKKVIVAVNKLDATMPTWDERVFEKVKSEISRFLHSAGFAPENIAFVPCSGLNGQNVVKPAPSEGNTAWVTKTSHTLLQELELSASADGDEAAVNAPLRMQIADVFRGSIQNPLSVSGRITSGNVQVGDSVMIQPSGETAVVKAIEVGNETKDWAVAGQLCTLHLTEIDPQHLRAGDILCSADKPVSVIKKLVAQVVALESLLPQGVDLHLGRLHGAGHITTLITIVDAKGEVVKQKPRVVKAGQRANIKVALDEGVPLGAGDRIVLRANGNTVAAGKIERVWNR
jgi:elongation factor 1 alpha-like protein